MMCARSAHYRLPGFPLAATFSCLEIAAARETAEPTTPSAAPEVRRILQQGPRDPRVTELLQSFLRKAAE